MDVDSDSRLYRALVCGVTPKNEKRALFWTRSHELTRSIDKHALSLFSAKKKNVEEWKLRGKKKRVSKMCKAI